MSDDMERDQIKEAFLKAALNRNWNPEQQEIFNQELREFMHAQTTFNADVKVFLDKNKDTSANIKEIIKYMETNNTNVELLMEAVRIMGVIADLQTRRLQRTENKKHWWSV